MRDAIQDRQEIADLVYRLGVVLDEGRFDELGALLVDDATARTPGGTASGRSAVVAQAARNHSTDQQIQHVLTNVLIDFDPVDADRATVRSNLVVSFAPVAARAEGQPAPQVGYRVGGVSRFGVARAGDGDGWRFTRVDQDPVWMSGTRPPVLAPTPNPVTTNR